MASISFILCPLYTDSGKDSLRKEKEGGAEMSKGGHKELRELLLEKTGEVQRLKAETARYMHTY